MHLAPRELLLTAIVMAGGVAGTIPLAQARGCLLNSSGCGAAHSPMARAWEIGSSGSCIARLTRGAGLSSILTFAARAAGGVPSTLSALGAWPPAPRPCTWMRRERSCRPVFGTVTVSTPFSKLACTCSGVDGDRAAAASAGRCRRSARRSGSSPCRPCARTSSRPGW